MKNFGRLVLAAILGSVITVGSYNLLKTDEPQVKLELEDSIPASKTLFTMNDKGDIVPLDFTGAAKKVTPAVVHITSTSVDNSLTQQDVPEGLREYFGPFFREQPRVGSGSGVIINAEGYIVTNNHVIANSTELEVTLNDNQSYKAEIIGSDPTTDIALIKIEAENLPYLAFTDSDQVEVGEWVLAVGNPYNLNSTVTAGIVSAKARSINIIQSNNKENNLNEGIESFIQTDAAVNPGNSGGALTNLNGGLIGINTAIASPTGSYSGYSFAVPSNLVKKVVTDLLEYGVVQRGWLGVVIRSVDNNLAKSEDLEVVRGAYISEIAENSGARDAGIKPGDVIVEVDGRKINTNSDVIGYVGRHRPGDIIKVTVNRFGNEKTFDVTLKNREGNTDYIKKDTSLFTKLGAKFEEVDSKELKVLDLEGGVRVKELDNNGLLRRETNMREGFIITRIAGKPVKKTEDIEKILSEVSGGVLIEGRYEEYSKTEYYALGID